MKKKLFIGLVIVAVAALAALNVNFNTQKGESLLNMANVEALANESGGSSECWNTIKKKELSQVFYCGTCSWVINSTDSFWAGKEKC